MINPEPIERAPLWRTVSGGVVVRRLVTTALGWSLLLLAVSCAHGAGSSSSGPQNGQSSQAAPTAPRPQLVSTPAAPQAPEDPDLAGGRRDLEVALADLRNVDVFFAFNQSSLTPQAREKLSVVAAILIKHPSLRLQVEGNCDERGTEAYNLLLGQERADTARTYLVNLGTTQDQVVAMSYGAERPKNPGHTEGAWQENRRDDVIVIGPKAQ